MCQSSLFNGTRYYSCLKTPPAKARGVLSGASKLPVCPAETEQLALVSFRSDFEADGLRLWGYQSFGAQTASRPLAETSLEWRPATDPGRASVRAAGAAAPARWPVHSPGRNPPVCAAGPAARASAPPLRLAPGTHSATAPAAEPR